MFTQFRWCGATAATVMLFLGASPANAAPAPTPTNEAVSPQTCPKIDALVPSLRAGGFTSQASQNYAVLIRRDCLDEV
jgi:hypothetical protein